MSKARTSSFVCHPMAALVAELSVSTGADGAVKVPTRIRVVPDGHFTGVDGRPVGMTYTPGEVDLEDDQEQARLPVECDSWLCNAKIAANVISIFESRGLDVVIDFDHQTLHVEDNGQRAPAAGWIKSLQYVAGDGIYANVEWTELGYNSIAKREYKYLSPVFTFDPITGAVLWLHSVALTNTPNLNQLGEIAAMRAARRLAMNNTVNHHHRKDTTDMELKTILVALGLPLETTEATALTALSAQAAKIKTLEAECADLRTKSFDPAQHIPLEEHRKTCDELAVLKASQDKAAHDQLMQQALSDGRILAPNEAYWRGQPLTALNAFLKDAKPIAALAGLQTGGTSPGDGAGAEDANLTADELAVCRSMGISAADFAKSKSAAAQ